MRQSQFFTKTSKTSPEGEETKNAILLTRAGFINKASSGVYSFLPLGFRVLKNINDIIREEMNILGAEEMLMPALIDKKYWEKTNRWETAVVYRTGRKPSGEAHDLEYGLGWTHEEVISAIALNFIQSYKDLPKAVYQIQTKFRAELRAQGGLLRGREFVMKDLYSFHENEADLERFYKKAISGYKKIFRRLGLKTLLVEASGGEFTKGYTHEFQVLNPVGEDTVLYCEICGFAQNKEVFVGTRHTKCKGKIKDARAIEVGNVFRLGTRFSDAFKLHYMDENGGKKPVFMGSYGIGSTRIMGAIVEEFNDDKGIIWPKSVSPFLVHLLCLKPDDDKQRNFSQKVYESLKKNNIQVLYDDRLDARPGEKFSDSDLIGIPYSIIKWNRC